MSDRLDTVAVVQARMGSTRLPGKAMEELGGYPILELVLRRVQRSETLDDVILATSKLPRDDVLADLGDRTGVPVIRGPEEDVLNRFVLAIDEFDPSWIVRVCADNPLVAPEEVDRIVTRVHERETDYGFNHVPAEGNGYPDGLGAEVVQPAILRTIEAKIADPYHHEHVTSYIWANKDDFRITTLRAPIEIRCPSATLDVDTPTDLERLRRLVARCTGDLVEWPGPAIIRTYVDLFDQD